MRSILRSVFRPIWQDQFNTIFSILTNALTHSDLQLFITLLLSILSHIFQDNVFFKNIIIHYSLFLAKQSSALLLYVSVVDNSRIASDMLTSKLHHKPELESACMFLNNNYKGALFLELDSTCDQNLFSFISKTKLITYSIGT